MCEIEGDVKPHLEITVSPMILDGDLANNLFVTPGNKDRWKSFHRTSQSQWGCRDPFSEALLPKLLQGHDSGTEWTQALAVVSSNFGNPTQNCQSGSPAPMARLQQPF